MIKIWKTSPSLPRFTILTKLCGSLEIKFTVTVAYYETETAVFVCRFRLSFLGYFVYSFCLIVHVLIVDKLKVMPHPSRDKVCGSRNVARLHILYFLTARFMQTKYENYAPLFHLNEKVVFTLIIQNLENK